MRPSSVFSRAFLKQNDLLWREKMSYIFSFKTRIAVPLKVFEIH